MNVGELYNILCECGIPVIADKLENCFILEMGYLPKILLHLKNEPPISTDFENFPSPLSHK